MNNKKKIFHFHPNGKLAHFFVKPLILAERGIGHNSNMVVSANLVDTDINKILIPYDLNLKNLFCILIAIFQIYRFFRRERPDVLVSHNSKSSSIVLICAWLAKVPKRIYFNHGVPYIAYKGFIKYTLISLELTNLFFATQVLTVSKDMLILLKGLDSSKEINIVNEGSACGLDLSLYGYKVYQNSTFRPEHNISVDDFLIVYIGRPEKRKGFHLILDIWVKNFSNENFKLVLCGPSESDVVNILDFLPANMICLGFSNRVPEILSQSDLLILPSFHEGLSYAVLEAMASGCIVVANDIVGNKHLIKSGMDGFLVENNNEKKYVEIIHRIAKKPKKDKILIQENAISSAKKYSRECFIPDYLSYIN